MSDSIHKHLKEMVEGFREAHKECRLQTEEESDIFADLGMSSYDHDAAREIVRNALESSRSSVSPKVMACKELKDRFNLRLAEVVRIYDHFVKEIMEEEDEE